MEDRSSGVIIGVIIVLIIGIIAWLAYTRGLFSADAGTSGPSVQLDVSGGTSASGDASGNTSGSGAPAY
jgi:hypothetical protein